jgi:hypothetical protein
MGTVDNLDQQARVAAMKQKADDLAEEAAATVPAGPGRARAAMPDPSGVLDIDDDDEGPGD